jgi:tripartite-type tricarboxylate transporter receptor subunit TctC
MTLKTVSRRSFVASIVGTAPWLAAALPLAASAQEGAWPNRAVKIVVPFPAGSFTDAVARVLSEHMAKSLGQTVLVENRVGANGMVGASEIAKATPDGYTFIITNSSSIVVNPQIYRKAGYKATSFTPVSMVIESPFVLAVNPDWAQKNNNNTVRDLVQYAERSPGKLSYGSAGQGNLAHLSFAMLSNRTNTKMAHIPYKASAAAQLALLGGEIDAMFDTWASVPHIKAGKLKALAVSAPNRMVQLPEVPTMAEAGYPDFNVNFWIGMLAPAGTPAPIVQKAHALSQALLQDANAKAVLGAQGDVVMLDPASFSKRIEKEVALWGGVIQREGITLD